MSRTTRIHWVVLFLGLILAVTAGCMEEVDVDPQPGSGSIDITGERTVNETGFFMDGTVHFDLAVDEPVRFENVTLCAFNERGRVLVERDLGTFIPASDATPFSVHSDSPPAYITVDHPNFRQFDRFSTETFVRVENGTNPSYRHSSDYLEEIQDEFPYPRNDMKGQCG